MESDEDTERMAIEDDLFSDAEDDGNAGATREDEAEEVDGDAGEVPKQAKAVKPKKIIKNPQPKLNFERLQGPRGLVALNDMFKDFKYKGNGHELEDLNAVLKNIEQWCNRLFPKFHFEDSLKRIESLGKQNVVKTYLKKIRMDLLGDDIVRQFDDEPEEAEVQNDVPMDDPFDIFLNEQVSHASQQMSHSSQQSSSTDHGGMTQEQKERMIRNRLLAEERRLSRLRAQRDNQEQGMQQVQTGIQDISVNSEGHTNLTENVQLSQQDTGSVFDDLNQPEHVPHSQENGLTLGDLMKSKLLPQPQENQRNFDDLMETEQVSQDQQNGQDLDLMEPVVGSTSVPQS